MQTNCPLISCNKFYPHLRVKQCSGDFINFFHPFYSRVFQIYQKSFVLNIKNQNVWRGRLRINCNMFSTIDTLFYSQACTKSTTTKSNYLINYLWNKMFGATAADPCPFVFSSFSLQCGKYSWVWSCCYQMKMKKVFLCSTCSFIRAFKNTSLISILN